MKNHESIHLVILRLFSGEADFNEKKEIAEWLELSVENKNLFLDLREIWLSTGIQNNADHYDLDNAIQNFREKIQEAKNKQHRGIRFVRILRNYAALVILALTLPVSYYFGTRHVARQQMTTIYCALGDKSNIILPDSSTVWLNSGSKLSFNSDFKNGGRYVILDGEAYFSVTKDKDHPFRVKTSEIEIKVLGTQFNVKSYAAERFVSATLVEGSLQIFSQSENQLIKPNQKILINKESGKMILNNLTDTSAETDWKKGRLVFRDETLEELKPKLERWFDVDIILADEQVKHRRFTGILERESILEVVSYFDLSKYITCRIKGNTIIIKTKNK